MGQDVSDALSVARDIRNQIFPTASAYFLAGSVVRGEATASSDLDLVVILERVENARRTSFIFADWPVEAFIHDPQTLEYFFREIDRPSGVPALPSMVSEGVEIPEETECGRDAKELARQVLEEGPIPWSQQDRDGSRYHISDLLEDVRAPRDPDELWPIVSSLYVAIANHFCRSRNQWSAKGKSIPGTLMRLDPSFHERFTEAFEAAFTRKEIAAVMRLAEEVLEPDGGLLFESYTRDAPAGWRMPDP